MTSWVLVLLTNKSYFEKAYKTIIDARQIGDWQHDIVLLVSNELYVDEKIHAIVKPYNVELRKLPERSFQKVIDLWKNYPHDIDYEYVLTRHYMLMKFYVMDVYFKRWKYVFYIDSGACIQGRLQRLTVAATPENCLYAHSDSYPTYETTLLSQFCLEKLQDPKLRVELLQNNLNCNYFQSTIMIYDTSIIDENTVEQLFSLIDTYPITRRCDQGIFNLHFLCHKNQWKQIPIQDDKGFLYDFHERDDNKKNMYLILKYPRT
jgi:hypothetical protein